jgi:hypothetical protein
MAEALDRPFFLVHNRRMKHITIITLLLVTLWVSGIPTVLTADTGKDEKNKIQSAPMFSVSFDGPQKPQLRELVLKMLAEISLEVGRELNFYPKRQVPVILLTDQAFFNIAESPKWSSGVHQGHIKVPVANYNPGLLRIVLAHEYVHAVLFDRLANRCPWWLNEGLARYFSGDRQGNKRKLELAAQFIKQGSIVPPLEQLPGNLARQGDSAGIQLAYALALSAVQYFADHFGMMDMLYVLNSMAEGKNFDIAVNEISGYSSCEFQEKWHKSYFNHR